MAEPTIQRYIKGSICIEIPRDVTDERAQQAFVNDLVGVYRKHGFDVEPGSFRSADGSTIPGLMMRIPYGIADFHGAG